MALPNANSPSFSGPIAAQSFQTTLTGNPVQIPQKIVRSTNGTTEVNVFGATNPVSGTFLGMKIIPHDDANGNITLQHTSAGTVVYTIAKGSAGAVKGSALPAVGVAFVAGATATIKSSTTANATVEIDFIASNPALPGAQ
jgi:hypothetical protein